MHNARETRQGVLSPDNNTAHQTHLMQYSMDTTLNSRFGLPQSLPMMHDESLEMPSLAIPPSSSWFGKKPLAYTDVLPLMTAVAFDDDTKKVSSHKSLTDLAASPSLVQ